ncbi:hypothetical protein [Streptomyces sp. NPDC001380]|uniref:hypothetical protein n=1 Tax=Streptomyces sp. NPDC001380 TaxID=3364566 RepID=UPI00368E0E8D
MAKMDITVCLPASDAGRIEAAVADAMAPFEIDWTRHEELDVWDAWWITGGEVHGGGYTVLPGHENDPRLIHETSSRWTTGHDPVPNAFGRCAGGPRGLLDFSATPEEARELAHRAWQRWQDLAAELPPARSWRFYYDRHTAERSYSFDRAVADHRAQPLVRAFDDYLGTLPTDRYRRGFLRFDPADDVGRTPREEFVRRRTAGALHRRNVLTLDGWWYEHGGPGLHGSCPGPADCPHEPGIPADQARIDGYLRDLPGDTLLVNVRCHV